MVVNADSPSHEWLVGVLVQSLTVQLARNCCRWMQSTIKFDHIINSITTTFTFAC